MTNVFTMCTDCLKKYGQIVGQNRDLSVSSYDVCCNDPEDCSDYEKGTCPKINKKVDTYEEIDWRG